MQRNPPYPMLAGLVVLALAGAGCTSSGPPGIVALAAEADVTAVEAALVERGKLTGRLAYSGNVQARKQVTLVARNAGRVSKVHVDTGSVVQAGEALVELDQEILVAQAAQAEAALAGAQARLDALLAGPRAAQVAQVQANLRAAEAALARLVAGPTPEQLALAEAQVRLAYNQRYVALAGADASIGTTARYTEERKEFEAAAGLEAIRAAEANLAVLKAGPTREQVDQAEATVEAAVQQLALARQPSTRYDIDAARAAVAQAQGAFDLALAQLAEATVRAPFDGVVAQRNTAPGALASAATPLLTLISAETEVTLSVEEGTLVGLKSGQEAAIRVAAYPGQEFRGTVKSIAPSVDPKTRTAPVKLAPRDEEFRLRDGMLAQVQVEMVREGVLLVPATAVNRSTDGSTFVFVVEDGRVRRQPVTTGGSDGRLTELVAGVTEGQQVVASYTPGLRDGDQVVVR